MNIRNATIEDIDILIKLRLDFLSADIGNLTADEESTIRTQLVTYFTKHINHDFIAVLVEIDNNVVSTAFIVISNREQKETRRAITRQGVRDILKKQCTWLYRHDREWYEENLPKACEVVRYFFNAGCRIRCCEQLIQVYFDIATERFSRLIDKFWPQSLELRLWSWEYYPGTA
jgi:hypothetical protein